MRRIVWVAVGAAGGIFAYRRGQQVLADARERGVVLSAQQAGASAAGAVASARALASSAVARRSEAARAPGDAAARVLKSRQDQQGE
ncbi:MAG: hypothetical protein IPO93_12170 [Actinobacteria bacterium]|nr:hypothetical protein [Actinomycetota bacterium]